MIPEYWPGRGRGVGSGSGPGGHAVLALLDIKHDLAFIAFEEREVDELSGRKMGNDARFFLSVYDARRFRSSALFGGDVSKTAKIPDWMNVW